MEGKGEVKADLKLKKKGQNASPVGDLGKKTLRIGMKLSQVHGQDDDFRGVGGGSNEGDENSTEEGGKKKKSLFFFP